MPETFPIREEHWQEAIARHTEKTEFFCYLCGSQGLMREEGGGDFYVGPSYLCLQCRNMFTMG